MCSAGNLYAYAGSTSDGDSTITTLQLHNDVFNSCRSNLYLNLGIYCQNGKLYSTYSLNATDCNEDYQFLAYLSYNMGDKWRMIGGCLEIEEAKLNTIDANHCTNESSEKAFQMLLTWATSDNKTISLNSLLDALKVCNFSICINCSANVSSVCALTQVGHLPVLESFLYRICYNYPLTKWLFIGRFLGLENHQLEAIQYNNKTEKVSEISYQMFLKWIASFGFNATNKCLARAFFLVHQLDSTCVNAAWTEIKTHFKLLCSTGAN